MTTATAAKPAARKPKTDAVEVIRVPLAEITGNSAQSRGTGVLPQLKLLGYGLFEKASPDTEPLWAMLTGADADAKQQACQLIAENEPEIVQFAEALAEDGQLQPIGVVPDGAGYDVVFGMRRSVALAYNYARDQTKPATVEAKVFNATDPAALRFIAYSENNDRQDENPIDRAMFYKETKKEYKLTDAQLAEKIGMSTQHVKDYVSLLDKALDDKRVAIQNREVSVDRAIKLLALRKKTGDTQAEDARGDNNGRERARLPNVKTILEIFNGVRPKNFSDERWALWTSDEVRKFLASELGLKFTPYKAPKQKEQNGQGKCGLQVTRGLADRLLVALGKTDAATWPDERVKERLEDIATIADPGQQVEDKNCQGLLDKLLANYARGLNVTIKNPKK